MGFFNKSKIKTTTSECIDGLIASFKVKSSGKMEELNIDTMISQLEQLFHTASFANKMDKPPVYEGQNAQQRLKDLLVNYSWGYVRSQGVKVKNYDELDKIKEEVDKKFHEIIDLF